MFLGKGFMKKGFLFLSVFSGFIVFCRLGLAVVGGEDPEPEPRPAETTSSRGQTLSEYDKAGAPSAGGEAGVRSAFDAPATPRDLLDQFESPPQEEAQAPAGEIPATGSAASSGAPEKYYSKWYPPHNYQTNVSVREGEILMAPYDENGPHYDEGSLIGPGGRISAEGAVF